MIVSPPGDTGKPRPAIVTQSDWLKATDSVLVSLLTSALVAAPLYRLPIEPSGAKCGNVIGRINDSERIALDHMLSFVIGIAD